MKESNPRILTKSIVAFCFFILLAQFSFAQTSFSKKVIVVIDHGALHCPHLGPKMQQVFSVKDTTDGMTIDKMQSTATYTVLSDSRWADKEYIRWAIIHLVGYPEQEIKSIEIN